MEKINLTKRQYQDLVKLAFIGERVLNTQHEEIQYKEESKLVNYLYSQNKKFGLDEYFDVFEDQYELNENITSRILPLIEEYTNKEFWPTLIRILTKRDFYEILQKREDVKDDEYEKLEEQISKKYLKEFNDNYIDNLRIKNLFINKK